MTAPGTLKTPSSAHELRQIEQEVRDLARRVRAISDTIKLTGVKAAFARQDCDCLASRLYGAADDAKRIRLPRGKDLIEKVPA